MLLHGARRLHFDDPYGSLRRDGSPRDRDGRRGVEFSRQCPLLLRFHRLGLAFWPKRENRRILMQYDKVSLIARLLRGAEEEESGIQFSLEEMTRFGRAWGN